MSFFERAVDGRARVDFFPGALLAVIKLDGILPNSFLTVIKLNGILPNSFLAVIKFNGVLPKPFLVGQNGLGKK